VCERKPISVRADHPLPPRDTGPSYFEIEVLKNEEDTDKTTLVGIGLCGEFCDLRDSWPGLGYRAFGYHGDGYHVENGQTESMLATYAEGDTIGCGVDWKAGAYYFTLNGTVIGKLTQDAQ
jgi:hypothetical protein